MVRRILMGLTAAAALLAAGGGANAGLIIAWNGDSGLSGRVDMTLLTPRELEVVARNTSTALPPAMAGDASNQLLTSISFDLPRGINILGGTAVLGLGARTVNFDQVSPQLTAGADVSVEWGYSNNGNAIDLARNVITAMRSQSTPFATNGNLDGPSNLNGPQGGLAADPLLADLGGLGAIQGPVVFRLQLSDDLSIAGLNQAYAAGAIEFGSDADYLRNPTPTAVPEPMTLALLGVGGAAVVLAARRRRRPA